MADKSKKETTKQKQSTGGSARKKKCQAYRAAHIWERNKVKRILQSSGREAATEYATYHGISGYLAELLRAKPLAKLKGRETT